MDPLDPQFRRRVGMILVLIGILMAPEVLSLSAIRSLRDNAIAISERASEAGNR